MQPTIVLQRTVPFGLTVVMLSAVVGAVYTMVAVQTSSIVVVTAVLLYTSLWIMQKSVGLFNFRAMSIPGFWYWLYLAFVLVPSFVVFSQHPGPYRTRYLVGVESTLITVPLGVWVANLVSDFKREETNAYFTKPLKPASDLDRPATSLAITLVLALFLGAVYLTEVRTVPLFYMLTNPGEYDALVAAREQSMKLLDSPLVYAYYVLRSTVFPLLILITLGRYLESRRGSWFVLLGVTLTSGVVYRRLSQS